MDTHNPLLQHKLMNAKINVGNPVIRIVMVNTRIDGMKNFVIMKIYNLKNIPKELLLPKMISDLNLLYHI